MTSLFLPKVSSDSVSIVLYGCFYQSVLKNFQQWGSDNDYMLWLSASVSLLPGEVFVSVWVTWICLSYHFLGFVVSKNKSKCLRETFTYISSKNLLENGGIWSYKLYPVYYYNPVALCEL